MCVYFPVRLICKTTCTRCNCERDDSRRRRHHHHHRSARTSISNGTKNVLCCQTATVLKELNRDNSGVIKFPVYFLRSHLQVYLLSIVCQMLMSTYKHTHTHMLIVDCIWLKLLSFFHIFFFCSSSLLLIIALYLESV